MKDNQVSRETAKDTDFYIELKEAFKRGGIPLGEKQAAKMRQYYDCLIEENKTHNLTRITGAREAAEKHFLDSALPVKAIGRNAKVIDVGSGAGFPIVPIKILREDAEAYALESSAKKCGFITRAAEEAGIELTVINGRAEELGRGAHRECYDVCVSRAVARLNILMELCVPLIKRGGVFLAYKSGKEEHDEANNACAKLGVEFTGTIEMPLEGYSHVIYIYKKKTVTPEKYPRKYPQILKSPL